MPPAALDLDFVFFDIGGTLGDRDPATSDLVPLSNAQGRALLERAGLASFLDPLGFVSEHDAGERAKPDPAIYRFAAEKVGVPVGRCLFVGEDLAEVLGAEAAGMKAVFKPRPPR